MKHGIIIPAILTLLLLSACSHPKEEFVNISGLAQGSTYSIKYCRSPKYDQENVKEDIGRILSDVDNSMSVYNDSSLISRINRNENVETDSLFNEVFRRSHEISIETEGAFDITVMPLVKAWGFGPDRHKTFNKSKLDSLLNLVGFRKVELKGNKVVKALPGVSLDLNAIAQGYTVDLICRYFDRLGIKDYIVEVGGEVRAKGKKGGEFWKIGIDRPVDDNMVPGADLQAIIKITNKAVSTSGNYRKFYIENGVKYSHEIDPKTGYPARNRVLSATIIADDCATADGFATACMVMGLERSISFIENKPDIQGYLVYSDDNGNFLTWISEGLRKSIEEEAPVNNP
ncbi:MAG: FAD:protein FMN transferase [Bacteroidales bacterium]